MCDKVLLTNEMTVLKQCIDSVVYLQGATKKRVEERLPLPELYNGKLVPGHTSQPVVLLGTMKYLCLCNTNTMISTRVVLLLW